MMENPEEVLSWLEEAARRRPATIPRELDEYLAWVARTGDSVYRWPLVRSLLKEKLIQVLHEFRALTPPATAAACSPNVPPFDGEAMRAVALARLDAFPAPPFTIQRICELLAHPRRHYNRLDKFMRAFEKNVLVVSTKEPEPESEPEPPRRQPPPPADAPCNDYDDDTDTEETCYPRSLSLSLSLNGPLLSHEPSSSTDTDEQENLSPGHQSDPEAATPETPYAPEPDTKSDDAAKSSDASSPTPNDYKENYDHIDTNEDTMSVQTSDDTELNVSENTISFRSAAEDNPPIINDDGDNASDVKSEDETTDVEKPPSPPIPEPDIPVEDSSKMVIESVDEQIQDDVQIDVIPTTSPTRSVPEIAPSPEENQPIDVVEPTDNLVEKSSTPPSSPREEPLDNSVESTAEEPKEDVAVSPINDNIDVTNVNSADETTEEPMDCAEEKVEVPSPVTPSEETNEVDEKMITEDSASSSEPEQGPQPE
ncbi:uncharacterized protein LOC143913429 [Arctopsyche grandis]|uniref:uncharacterized protein LOC143913429 n=1 Tax=Arctopsyche grandis TaxID=121162 RepID=UPI00406D9C1C